MASKEGGSAEPRRNNFDYQLIKYINVLIKHYILILWLYKSFITTPWKRQNFSLTIMKLKAFMESAIIKQNSRL